MEKIINVNSLNSFYKKLRLYKIIYGSKRIKLDIEDSINELDKEELLMCEKAFNIKDKNKRVEYVYDAICDFHDKLYIDTNICEFDDDGNCIAKRNKKCRVKSNGCCGKCKYLGKDGCTIKCMSCKGYFCKYIRKIKNIKSIRKQKGPYEKSHSPSCNPMSIEKQLYFIAPPIKLCQKGEVRKEIYQGRKTQECFRISSFSDADIFSLC